jgi:hypothetical protein
MPSACLYQNVFMLVALIATASLSYLQFDSGDILLIAATIATVGAKVGIINKVIATPRLPKGTIPNST